MDRPVTSEGSRSGVNWIRRKLQPRLLATALASIVLPVPGTSSIKRWPRDSNATRVSLTSWRLPMITRSTFAATLSPVSLMVVICLSCGHGGGDVVRDRVAEPCIAQPLRRDTATEGPVATYYPETPAWLLM